MKAEIGIIGGYGVAPIELMEDVQEVEVPTPYGSPSDKITLGTFKGRRIAVLSRHGKNHSIRPSAINYRANIFALKELGVSRILSPNAVGSLQEEIKPGELVFVDQFIDRTQGRKATFYDKDKVCHISVAEPFCPELRATLSQDTEKLGFPKHQKGTYVCIEGPRFSTRAESRLFRQWGGDVIGMTLVPESVLAREAQICYASIAMVTDYDTFKEPVSIDTVITTLKKNEQNMKKIITSVLETIPAERSCGCGKALDGALI